MMSRCLGEGGVEKLSVSVSFGKQALFRWKGKSCADGEAGSCCLGHGDILVMDGQCQDEFLHCTDPGLEQDRINVTFRWIRQHVASCSFVRTGVACCLPTCAQGCSALVTELVENGVFWAFWVLSGALCTGEVLALLVNPFMCTGPGLSWCVKRVVGYGAFGTFWVLLGVLCHVHRTRVTEVCQSLDTPMGRKSVEA